jgi:hypothetical protein
MKQTRRQLLGSLLAGFSVAGIAGAARAGSGAQLPAASTGRLKAGPLGLNPAADDGEIPVAILIPDAEVDAEVERNKIVGGQMLDPSGPWVVAWYEGTGLVGERDNAVMSGHVDYWDVGPAVFRNVANLHQGSEIDVQGEDGTMYTYTVEYVERITLEELDQDKINEIVGKTDYAALTLITCGGDFDYNAGEYLQRDVIRARLAESAAPAGSGQAANPPAEGAQATVTGDVNLRSSASTSGDIVRTLATGDTVTITGASQEAEGYTWVPVRLADGTEGWIVQDYVAPAQ